MTNYRRKTIIIKPDHKAYDYLDNYALAARYLRNSLNYERRQQFFNKKMETELDIRKRRIAQQNPEFMALPAKISRDISRDLDKSWKSYFALRKEGIKASIPGYYRGDSRGSFKLSKDTLRMRDLKKGNITITRIPEIIGRTNLKWSSINEIRVLPREKCFVVEVVYVAEEVKREKRVVKQIDDPVFAGADLGVDNLIAITCNNVAIRPLIIDGKQLKSINQLANKKSARMKSELPNGVRSSSAIRKLWFKRNQNVDSLLHAYSNQVRNYCLLNNIEELYIGWSDGFKQRVNIGKRNNQNFVNIPHKRFIEMLTYKLKSVGVLVILTEESYTSKTSFVDDELPVKAVEYVGKRVKRGLFRSGDGLLLNADVNAAGQILRKCKPELTVKDAVGKGVEGMVGVLRPVKVSDTRRLSCYEEEWH